MVAFLQNYVFRSITAIIVGLLLAQPLIACVTNPSETYRLVATASSIELTLDYGNSTQQVFTNQTAATVFDLLNQTAEITYTEFDYGKFINSINGVANNADGNGYFWQYWVNNELAPVAADSFELSDGDRVLWRYCAPQHTPTTSTTPGSDWWIWAAVIATIGGLMIGTAFLINRKLR